MLSYLTSATPQSLPQFDLKAAKAALTAVTTVGGQLLSNNNRNSNKKRKLNTDLISKSYNVVASRPMARIRNQQNVITANLRYDVVTFTSSTSVNIYSSEVFQLNKFDGYAEYTGLFDQYRINEIEVWFEPIVGPAVALTDIGVLTTAIDLDDTSVPTAFATIEDKQSALTTGGLTGHYHRWKPSMAVATYSGTFTSFSNAPAGWIDAGSPGVQHYGLKVGITPTSVAIGYRTQVRASISFKQPGL